MFEQTLAELTGKPYTPIIDKKYRWTVWAMPKGKAGKLDYHEAKQFIQSHDRFLIIDGKEVYHFGASLKDLGKKWFAFSKMNKSSVEGIVNAVEVAV